MIDPPGIFIFNNENYCVLFPFIHGIKCLDTPETPVRQLWQTSEIARFLGRMHSNIETEKFKVISSIICLITDQYTKSIPLIRDEDEQDIFEKNLVKNLPIGYIHADIHDDNVLLSPTEKKIAAVLDFDDMYVDPLLIDLALALCLWCGIAEVGNSEIFDHKSSQVIGY
ncbi:unnamed protein product [Rotaria socialis]|uniref:Aminoglycoside phosphotransferase domain-containing protein n=1 Tax=Rotaria socialis TaxID=392032 RepID=A0A818I6N2_9BILA|nr:unnamed protein product [Rotaria socialis]